MADGPVDIVLWGATGFTGRLVAEYLTQHYPQLRLGLAGRSAAKLAQLQSGLRRESPAALISVLIGDASDAASVRAAVGAAAARAGGAGVVLSTAGPYSIHGTPVVEACVESRVDFFDISGETLWMRDTIDRFHARAAADGTRVVHACGFDSVPLDVGARMVATALKSAGKTAQRVEHLVGDSKGQASGGTLATMMHMLGLPASEKRKLKDPNLLAAPAGGGSRDRGVQAGARFSALAGSWTAPFVMASINEAVARRSAALLGPQAAAQAPAGPGGAAGGGSPKALFAGDYSVTECVRAKGRLSAVFLAGAQALLMGTLAFPPLRPLLRRVLPKPGEGPSRAQMAQGYFQGVVIGQAADGTTARAALSIDGDPGYSKTAVMLAEAGLCSLLQRKELEAAARAGDVVRGGVLSPACALGDLYIARLNNCNAGFKFVIEQGPTAPGGAGGPAAAPAAK